MAVKIENFEQIVTNMKERRFGFVAEWANRLNLKALTVKSLTRDIDLMKTAVTDDAEELCGLLDEMKSGAVAVGKAEVEVVEAAPEVTPEPVEAKPEVTPEPVEAKPEVTPEPVEAKPEVVEAAPVKVPGKRGRPAGSKNKPKVEGEMPTVVKVPGKRGRPAGSKNKPKEAAPVTPAEEPKKSFLGSVFGFMGGKK